METLSVVDTKPLPVPESRWERILYALIVIVLPVVCFSLSSVLKPEWQSGKFSDYVALLLLPEVALFFFPFLAYAGVSMSLLLIAPQRFVQFFAVRLGIYTGSVLALHYAILTTGTDFLIISTISAAILILSKWLLGKIKSHLVAIGIILLLILLAALGAMLWGHIEVQQLWFIALIAILSGSPFFCLAIAVVTSLKLLKHYETKAFTFQHGQGLFAWLAAYGLAWRLSILKAIEVYHSLPPSPPDCYVATAAARGHKSLVQSQMVALPSGRLWVNPQLQNLKCAELVLMALIPGLHRPLRKTYDLVGRALARCLTNPFLADLAYLTLKPLEWLAYSALKILIPEIDQYAQTIYSEN